MIKLFPFPIIKKAQNYNLNFYNIIRYQRNEKLEIVASENAQALCRTASKSNSSTPKSLNKEKSASDNQLTYTISEQEIETSSFNAIGHNLKVNLSLAA